METEIDLDQLEQERADKYFSHVIEMFPDVDFSFLESKCIEFAFDQEGFNNFLEDTMLQNKYPKQQASTSNVTNEVTNEDNNFTVEAFVEKFPDPEKYFLQADHGSKYITHSLSFLQDRFRFGSATTIRLILRRYNFNLYRTYKELQKLSQSRKTPRRQNEIVEGIGKPPREFFDEINFIINEQIILEYLKDKLLAREAAVEEARKAGALLTCGCCFSDDLLTEEIVTCSEGHLFCRNCVTKSTEVLMGDGKIDFPCLEDCGAFFHVETLKNVMLKGSYEKLLKKLQEREIALADIPGLESCPFCEYSVIPDQASRIFECLSCKRSSCRLCRKESHIPYSCSEVNDDMTKSRTYVEEKMTEALIRNCYRCGSKFIREDGCNKMTCHCGAKMCYICRKPITGYNHFSDRKDHHNDGKCPLWTNNNNLHKVEVNLEAEKAIEEVKRKNPEFNIEVYKKLRK